MALIAFSGCQDVPDSGWKPRASKLSDRPDAGSEDIDETSLDNLFGKTASSSRCLQGPSTNCVELASRRRSKRPHPDFSPKQVPCDGFDFVTPASPSRSLRRKKSCRLIESSSSDEMLELEVSHGASMTSHETREWQELVRELLARPQTAPSDGFATRIVKFWTFVADALLGPRSSDSVCSTFKLGGSIDRLGDVAFTRDAVIAPFLRIADLQSLVWHCLLICWLGAGGPEQDTFKLLCSQNLICAYDETDTALLHSMYRYVQTLVETKGISRVFHGDSRSVRWRLDERQQGERVLESWFTAVPMIAGALGRSVEPLDLDRIMTSVHYIGELTAKELYVLLSYAQTSSADTTRHCPVGGGARAGAELVLFGDGGVPVGSPTPRRSNNSSEKKQEPRLKQGQALEAIRAISSLKEWAAQYIPNLKMACREYQSTAEHRHDQFRNCRVRRPELQLFDLADVEVMLCYYKNYSKLKARFGSSPIPASCCPRGWTRYTQTA